MQAIAADDRTALCHRCRNARVRVFGMQCADCQKTTDAEYWEERRRRGGKLLYLEGVDLDRVTRGMQEDEEMWDDPDTLADEVEEDEASKPIAAERSGGSRVGHVTRGRNPERDAAIVDAATKGEESYTQIGKRFGITQERVRQIVVAAQGRNGNHASVGSKPRALPVKAQTFAPAVAAEKWRQEIDHQRLGAQELADRITERVLAVVDHFELDFNLGSCLRLLLERDATHPKHELADLIWARKYLDRAIARIETRISALPSPRDG